jgi:hypothetical protein
MARRQRRAGAAVVGLILAASVAHAARAPRSLPGLVAPEERDRLERIAQNAVVSTRMELPPYPARPKVFEYLLDHPDFATRLTRALRLARYQVWRTPTGFFLDDGWGAKGEFSVAYAAPGMRVMYCKGRFEPPLLPDIHGQAVVVLEYEFRPHAEPRRLVATAVSGYVTLDNRLLKLAGRLAGPVAQAKADREARALLRVFARVTEAIEASPEVVLGKLRAFPGVPPREMDEFRDLLAAPAAGAR